VLDTLRSLSELTHRLAKERTLPRDVSGRATRVGAETTLGYCSVSGGTLHGCQLSFTAMECWAAAPYRWTFIASSEPREGAGLIKVIRGTPLVRETRREIFPAGTNRRTARFNKLRPPARAGCAMTKLFDVNW
jgi:hypothetical protein